MIVGTEILVERANSHVKIHGEMVGNNLGNPWIVLLKISLMQGIFFF